MLTVLEVTFPVFGLVFCGFAGAYLKLLPDKAVEGINAFVFWFALPAMLFRVIAQRPFAELFEPAYIGAYLLASAVLFFGTMYAARRGWLDPAQRGSMQATAYALTATHGNVGYMGIALVAELNRDFLPTVALTIICDIFAVITVAIAMLEVQDSPGRQRNPLVVAATVARGLLRSPLVMSLLIGLLCSLAAIKQPSVIDNFTRLLSNAAGPCALFAIGAALGGQRMAADRPVIGLSLLKLIVHPLLAAISLLWLFRVDPQIAAVGVLCAALPSASNTFIIAQRYRLDTRAISASILVGTFVALVTVSLTIWLLGLRT